MRLLAIVQLMWELLLKSNLKIECLHRLQISNISVTELFKTLNMPILLDSLLFIINHTL